MGNWTVGKKLDSGVGALVALLVLSGVVAITVTRLQNRQIAEATGPLAKKLELATEMERHAHICKSALRRAQIAGYTRDQQALVSARQELDESLDDILTAAADMQPLIYLATTRQALNEAVATAKDWGAVKDEVLALIEKGQVDEARGVVVAKSNPLVDRFIKATEEMSRIQTGLMQEAANESASEYRLAVWLILGVLLTAAGVGAAVIYAVRGINVTLRRTARELRETSEQVVSASSQVSTAAQSLSQGATELAASLEESSASMEEMGSMTSQNAENAGEAAVLMEQVDQQVVASNRLLQEMVTSMAAIQESSSKVSKIIKTIDEIAFQTNILALNAAVEAARAGEAGMGFAVVADEVRNLAQRAAQAARDTAGLIEASSTSAQEGVEKVQRVAHSFGQFTESVGKVKAIADGVSAASQQQAQGIRQVTTAIQQMEKVTQTTAATAEESAAASEELNAQAETSMQLVEQLEAMVGRGEGRPVRAAQARPAARPGGKVMALGTASKSRSRTPEQQIPLDDQTGTFGSF